MRICFPNWIPGKMCIAMAISYSLGRFKVAVWEVYMLYKLGSFAAIQFVVYSMLEHGLALVTRILFNSDSEMDLMFSVVGMVW